MSLHMLNQLHGAKVTEINKDERIPWDDVPKAVRRDMDRLREANQLTALLSSKIRLAGFEPDSHSSEGAHRPYDWRRKEKSRRIAAVSTLKTQTHIALMKCKTNPERAVVIERYVKQLARI